MLPRLTPPHYRVLIAQRAGRLGDLVHRRLAPLAVSEYSLYALHVDIDHGRDVQREQLRNHQAADLPPDRGAGELRLPRLREIRAICLQLLAEPRPEGAVLRRKAAYFNPAVQFSTSVSGADVAVSLPVILIKNLEPSAVTSQ